MPTTATVLPALRRGDTYDALTFTALEAYPNDSTILAQVRNPATLALLLTWPCSYADGSYTLQELTPTQTASITEPGLYVLSVQITQSSGRTKTQISVPLKVLQDYCFVAPPTTFGDQNTTFGDTNVTFGDSRTFGDAQTTFGDTQQTFGG